MIALLFPTRLLFAMEYLIITSVEGYMYLKSTQHFESHAGSIV